ncbi:MAG: ATP-dependent DNA helicase [Holophaga sp.]|nr:ATP-dependent DNA helicase [Holophaga sp.]
MDEPDSLNLSVRSFVAPLEPTGSLDARLASLADEDPQSLGARTHARIQKRLLQEDPRHQSELSVRAELSRPGFRCLVRGRLDLLLADPATVEEIKTGFRPGAILQELRANPDHPFALQARMYAWMLWRETGAAPMCRLRVVSLLDDSEELLDLPFDPEPFGAWVEARLQAHHEAFLRARARAAERRELGARLSFPFPDPRPGQTELVDRVARSLAEGRRLLLQAPTGLGKTAAILYPALARALDQDLQVFYCTPRNSQHQVAEDCVRRIRAQGHPVRSVTLRAKEKVCPQPEVNCRPDVCPRANLYYDRLRESGALASLAALGCASSADLAAEADRNLLCPFELALDAAPQADVVIGDYNYVFSPNATLARLFGAPEDSARRIVLVDEAHNLPARAAEWFSPALELPWLEQLRKRRQLPPDPALRRRVSAQIRRCEDLLRALDGGHRLLQPDPLPFFGEEYRIGKLLAWAAGNGRELGPAHPLTELYQAWAGFCAVLRTLDETHVVSWIPPGRLQITCADASSHLQGRMAALAGAVLFSATLKPFQYHQRLAGLDVEAAAVEVPSPFPPGNRKVLVVPQISTLYRSREREAPRMAQFLERVLPLRFGNYFVFFPSFELLEKTAARLQLPGFQLLLQPRRASAAQLETILARLRGETGVVVLAVQGGSLSEGIDCPGETLIGCVVVGPALPPYDLERDQIRQYFDRKYGCGEAYAYLYPAAAKAFQAAGRVIRTPQDKGLLVFLDRRFLGQDYAPCYPQGWFRDSPRELVSAAILADVQAFWN